MSSTIIEFDDERFRHDLEKLIRHEGGWRVTDDKDDPDLATFAGVRYISYVRWCKKNDYEFISLADFKTVDPKHPFLREAVAHIYYDDYYTPSGAIYLKFEPTIRYMIFSAAVNHGNRPVVKMIQRILKSNTNLLLIIDGKFGPATLTRFKTYLLNNDEEEFIIDFMHQWLLYYVGIVQRNAKAWEDYAEELKRIIDFNNISHPYAKKPLRTYKFLKGWINRVFKAL